MSVWQRDLEPDPFWTSAEILAWIWVVVVLVGAIILAGHLAGCTLARFEASKTTCQFDPLVESPWVGISHPALGRTCMSDSDWALEKWYANELRGEYMAAANRCSEGIK